MRAAGSRQNRCTRTDIVGFVVERHHPSSAQHVIDLVFVLLVIADARARLQDAFTKGKVQVRRLVEKDIADRLSRPIVRTGFRFRDVAIALNDVAAFVVRLLGGNRGDREQQHTEREGACHRDAP